MTGGNGAGAGWADRPVLIPGPDHPIDVVPDPQRVVVRRGASVVADSSKALLLSEAGRPPVRYIPLRDVRADAIRPSSHTTYCPYKGVAGYYDLRDGDGWIANAIWTYAEPYAAVSAIAGHVAFYADKVTTGES